MAYFFIPFILLCNWIKQAELVKYCVQLCSPPYSYNAELNLCWRLETEERRATWSNARTQCQSEGGDLIILDTPAKVAFIQNALANVSIPGYYVFVGGEDMTEKGRFRWINGEPVNGIPWHSGRPVGRDGQRCLTMSIHYSFTFYDVQCTDVYTDVFTFLCQKK